MRHFSTRNAMIQTFFLVTTQSRRLVVNEHCDNSRGRNRVRARLNERKFVNRIHSSQSPRNKRAETRGEIPRRERERWRTIETLNGLHNLETHQSRIVKIKIMTLSFNITKLSLRATANEIHEFLLSALDPATKVALRALPRLSQVCAGGGREKPSRRDRYL